MGQFTLRFRVRDKDKWSLNKEKITLSGTRLAENPAMTENQPHFVEGESPQQNIVLFMDTATDLTAFTIGKDVLVTFNGPAS